MHTHIPNLMETPFRGITTIQLFDKEGNLIEETQHENTYNQRLQFFSYVDTILKCRMSSIPFSTDFTLNMQDTREPIISEVYSSHILGGGSTTYSVLQPYATLWLTNKTANEDLNGYPNGIPVAYATTAGVPSGVASDLAAGFVNMSESYLNNDRLHLVFDFDTSRGNVTFDSLWFYPSASRAGLGASAGYSVIPFFHGLSIFASDHPTFNMPLGPTRVYQRPLNNYYTMLVFSNTPASSKYEYNTLYAAIRAVIFNEETGAIISDCTFNSNTDLRNVFYFDEGSNNLYQIYSDVTADRIFEESTLSNSTGASLYKINLTTGVREFIDYTKNLFGMKKGDYNYNNSSSGTWAYNTHVYNLAKENTTVVMIPTEGPDADTGLTVPYISWFIFDPLLKKFNLVKKLKIYSSATVSSSISPNLGTYSSFVKDDLLYLRCAVSPDLSTYNNLAVFNIKTGELLYDKGLSLSTALRRWPTGAIEYTRYLDPNTSNNYISFDLNRYKTPMLKLSTSVPSTTSFTINQISTAFWTTHNKLSSPVTKTDQTTMKIQYDIIWDNIKDTIVPGLL